MIVYSCVVSYGIKLSLLFSRPYLQFCPFKKPFNNPRGHAIPLYTPFAPSHAHRTPPSGVAVGPAVHGRRWSTSTSTLCIGMGAVRYLLHGNCWVAC